MPLSIAIVGAGLIGRTLALELIKEDCHVTLFDSDDASGLACCAFSGVGMLAPYAELESSSSTIFELGWDAVALWTKIVECLPSPVFMQTAGTLLVAHGQDQALLTRAQKLLGQRVLDLGPSNWLMPLSDSQVYECEPSLSTRFSRALFLPFEGQLDNRQLLQAMAHALKIAHGANVARVQCHFNTRATSVMPGKVETANDRFRFDLVIDCRGLGAREDLKTLRGVRGEVIDVVAPQVKISRPVRLMHPRYPIYIAPREENHYLIGATSIESESQSPITVQSTLELLSAAYAVDSAFAEAYIHEFRVNCRPALPDNGPRIFHQDGLIRVNGLYRHGFLVTPKLVQILVQFVKTGYPDQAFGSLFKEEESLLCKS